MSQICHISVVGVFKNERRGVLVKGKSNTGTKGRIGHMHERNLSWIQKLDCKE